MQNYVHTYPALLQIPGVTMVCPNLIAADWKMWAICGLMAGLYPMSSREYPGVDRYEKREKLPSYFLRSESWQPFRVDNVLVS